MSVPPDLTFEKAVYAGLNLQAILYGESPRRRPRRVV